MVLYHKSCLGTKLIGYRLVNILEIVFLDATLEFLSVLHNNEEVNMSDNRELKNGIVAEIKERVKNAKSVVTSDAF